jgi:hypothetical protein
MMTDLRLAADLRDLADEPDVMAEAKTRLSVGDPAAVLRAVAAALEDET